MHKKHYKPISNKNITITDKLFGHYADMISETVLPYQWAILNDLIEGAEKSHCLENFRIAAGEKEGCFYGAVFQDTDIYKWLETVAYCIESGKGEKFIDLADEVIELISKAQQPDGYLNTYYTIEKPDERWTNLLEGHELYSAGHLIEAATAYFKSTGKRVLLDTAVRFADLIADTFGPEKGQIKGYPGHQEIELALVKLYRLTGCKRYLETARFFIDQRGAVPNYFTNEIENRKGEGLFPEFKNYDLKYSQAHTSPVSQYSIEGHAVRAMYMCATMADLALEYEDESLEKACQKLWDSTTEKRMFITGGVGSSGFLERFTSDYDLPNDRTYCETCASVGLMMFGQRMTSLTGDAAYYDSVELALHNTVLAGINADGMKYFYVNPLEVRPDFCMPATSMSHVKPVRQDWFSVACCPTNVARTLASLGQYIYAVDDERLYIHQFISSEVRSKTPDEFNLEMDADITGSGRVRIETDRAARLCIRIPQYVRDFSVVLNGKNFKPVLERNYACFNLKEAAEIEIDLNIYPRWVAANNNVRENTGKIALMYGPYAYCLEEIDNFKHLTAVIVDPDSDFKCEKRLIDLPGNMPVVEYDGYQIDSGVGKLYGRPEFRMKSARITAVPYCLWCNREPGEMLVWQKARL